MYMIHVNPRGSVVNILELGAKYLCSNPTYGFKKFSWKVCLILYIICKLITCTLHAFENNLQEFKNNLHKFEYNFHQFKYNLHTFGHNKHKFAYRLSVKFHLSVMEQLCKCSSRKRFRGLVVRALISWSKDWWFKSAHRQFNF